jgi:hypothetical protein
MSGLKNYGLNVQEYLYDFAVDGGSTGAISLSSKAGYYSLPDNAFVYNVCAEVLTAVVGTSSTLAWGNTTDPDGYQAATAEATLVADYVAMGGTAAAALLWDDTNDHLTGFCANSANDRDFSVTIGTADLTAGKVAFHVMYLLHSAR